MKNARKAVTAFVLDHLETEPLTKRIEMLRALAVIAATPLEAAKMHQHADELELVQRSYQQLVLDFKLRSS